MSNPKLKYDKTKTAQQIQQAYAETCTQLGQAIFAEAEAIRQQSDLQDRQKELAEAFKEAAAREQAHAQNQAKADAATKAFEEKAPDTAVTTESTLAT